MGQTMKPANPIVIMSGEEARLVGAPGATPPPKSAA